MNAVLKTSQLTKTYSSKQVVKELSMTIQQGDIYGFIGKNGAGKTTLIRMIAGLVTPSSGSIELFGSSDLVKERAKIGTVIESPALFPNMTARENLITQCRIANVKDLRVVDETLELVGLSNTGKKKAKNFSLGMRQRLAIAIALIGDPEFLILDEPTNHLDADSIEWLRGYLKKYEGGFLVISHSTELLDEVVNKVWHLDAQLGQIDMYSLGWKAYLHQRVVDEERRRREREVAEKKADRLMKQGIRLHAKATKAVAAQNMMRRAEKLLENTSEAQKAEKVADIRFPEPAPCGRTPIMAKDISKAYGSNIVFAGVNLAIDKGSRVVILGYNGAGKTTTLRLLAHIEEPDTGSVEYGHGCKIGYFAQEHDTLDLNATVLENLQHVAPELDNTQARSILGSFLFSGDDAMKPAHVLSGGEKTRLALATLVTSRANVLLLDEPTNNLDPASREEILKAIAKYEGAIVLVTHDEGAVEALNPERVLLMPDGDEDLWNDSYLELVAEE